METVCKEYNEQFQKIQEEYFNIFYKTISEKFGENCYNPEHDNLSLSININLPEKYEKDILQNFVKHFEEKNPKLRLNIVHEGVYVFYIWENKSYTEK